MILDDGTRFCGHSFGAHKNISGEVVFNTAMTGYTESLTDPSYAGQIMVLTYPLIGNYGVPASDLWESEHIHAEALIVSEKRHRSNRGKNAVDGLPIGGIF